MKSPLVPTFSCLFPTYLSLSGPSAESVMHCDVGNPYRWNIPICGMLQLPWTGQDGAKNPFSFTVRWVLKKISSPSSCPRAILHSCDIPDVLFWSFCKELQRWRQDYFPRKSLLSVLQKHYCYWCPASNEILLWHILGPLLSVLPIPLPWYQICWCICLFEKHIFMFYVLFLDTSFKLNSRQGLN